MDNAEHSKFDLEKLSLIKALRDIGFTAEEVEDYMKLHSAGKSSRPMRLKMINQRRSQFLDEIHFREKQLMCMDYLKSEIRKGK